MMFVDSHCHLRLADFEDFIKERSSNKPKDFYEIGSIVNRAVSSGVNFMLNIGTQLSDVDDLTRISNEFPNVFRTIGIHPQYAEEHLEKFSPKEMREIFEKICSTKKTIGIGEIGLDYHSDSDREKQQKLFHSQLEFAERFGMPISVIHVTLNRTRWIF